MWQDLLYGFRMLLKKPGFAVVAALSLGLGIGANATIFSIINATLLSDLPYPDANRLMVLWTVPLNRPGIFRGNVTAGNYLAWKERNQSFQAIGGLYGSPAIWARNATDLPPSAWTANTSALRCGMFWAYNLGRAASSPRMRTRTGIQLP